MKKFFYAMRILTVAPIIAAITFSILFFVSPEFAGGTINYLLGLLFITVLPLLAYPLQPVIPKFKGKGRDGQRNLAIIMSVIGYIGGSICAFALKMPRQMKVLFLTYLISGILVLIFSKVIKYKASGHACGVSGPIAFLTYIYGPVALLGLPLLAVVFWSSLKMRRHRWGELIAGSIIPVAALLISILIA